MKDLARARSVSQYHAVNAESLLIAFGVDPGSSGIERDKSLRDGIELSIAAVPDEQYRDAAYAILGFSDNRWSSLRERQSDAARAFSIGFDAFRRRRSGSDVSLYVECLREVARAIQRDDLGAEMSLKGTDDISARLLERPGGSASHLNGEKVLGPRKFAVVGSLAVLAALLGGSATSFLFVRTDDTTKAITSGRVDLDQYCRQAFADESSAVLVDNTAAGWRCQMSNGDEAEVVHFGQACSLQYGHSASAQLAEFNQPFSWSCAFDVASEEQNRDGCSFEPGSYLASGEAELALYAQDFLEAYEVAGGAELIGCPSTPLYRSGPGIAQDLVSGGRAVGVILSLEPESEPIVLQGSALAAFDRLGEGFGMFATLFGYPLSEPMLIDGAWQIRGSNSGVLVAREAEGQYFLVSQMIENVWIESGGPSGSLGMPVSDLYGRPDGLRQDFENGYVQMELSGQIRKSTN